MSQPLAERPTGPGTARDLAITAAVGLAIVAGIAWWAWPSGRPPADSRQDVVQSTGHERFVDRLVGDKACAECHPGEASLHARSGHAQTLTRAGNSPIAALLDGQTIADPDLPGVSWSYHRDGDTFRVDRHSGETTEPMAIDYAFGSGTHATTFASIIDGPAGQPALFEHRLTRFADGHMGVTPGHDTATMPRGRRHGDRTGTEGELLRCLGCHATATASTGKSAFVAEEMLPDVRCESCHGPGRDHVDRAHSGAKPTDLRMPFGPGRYKAEAQMRLCGQCHRHPDAAPPGVIRPENTELVRFQPVGLMQSACYKKSDGQFSCSTCHDSHARPVAEDRPYNDTCQKCHAGTATTSRSCPVSAAGNCVACHMPKVDSGHGGIQYADHWIRVRSDNPGPSEPKSRVSD